MCLACTRHKVCSMAFNIGLCLYTCMYFRDITVQRLERKSYFSRQFKKLSEPFELVLYLSFMLVFRTFCWCLVVAFCCFVISVLFHFWVFCDGFIFIKLFHFSFECRCSVCCLFSG